MQKPSKQLEDALECRTQWDDVDPAIRSWAQFYVYKAARWALAAGDKEAMRERLDQAPQCHRERIRAEMVRLHRYRRSGT